MSKIRIGTQGWNYEDWLGSFYPRGAKSADFFDLYARVFDTVEIDSTFYAIPSEASINSWRRRAPRGFVYSLKLPQEITHRQRLRECGDVLGEFCERARGLEERLGVVLIQLPPDFSPRSWNALESFVPSLPSDMRFAVEFRDDSWLGEELCERTLGLLNERGVALALVDSKWIPREISIRLAGRVAADFAYVRWMGPRELTEFSRIQISRDREMGEWAAAFEVLGRGGGTIYGYFNNHYQGHSPGSANHFKRLIGETVIDPESLVEQPSLF
ncbi:MAG TPA: DUF72 domain-containing protein [Blastocatellia bacterium]|nr:DUF72 domain-containing protein [Blastocatellia bacterium]